MSMERNLAIVQLKSNLRVLERAGCQFPLRCDGPDKPPVDMGTCFARYEIRRTKAVLEYLDVRQEDERHELMYADPAWRYQIIEGNSSGIALYDDTVDEKFLVTSGPRILKAFRHSNDSLREATKYYHAVKQRREAIIARLREE